VVEWAERARELREELLWSYAQIGREVGVSKERVRKVIGPDRPSEPQSAAGRKGAAIRWGQREC
jgi:hypothetical protein